MDAESKTDDKLFWHWAEADGDLQMLFVMTGHMRALAHQFGDFIATDSIHQATKEGYHMVVISAIIHTGQYDQWKLHRHRASLL